MATFTLFEQMVPGDATFVPPDPAMGPPLQRSVGDQLIIIDRPLLDKNGNQRGSFVLHGTLLRIFSNVPNLDVLLSFQASNTITGKGVINTQRATRFLTQPPIPQEFRATIYSSLSEWWSTVMESSAAR